MMDVSDPLPLKYTLMFPLKASPMIHASFAEWPYRDCNPTRRRICICSALHNVKGKQAHFVNGNCSPVIPETYDANGHVFSLMSNI